MFLTRTGLLNISERFKKKFTKRKKIDEWYDIHSFFRHNKTNVFSLYLLTVTSLLSFSSLHTCRFLGRRWSSAVYSAHSLCTDMCWRSLSATTACTHGSLPCAWVCESEHVWRGPWWKGLVRVKSESPALYSSATELHRMRSGQALWVYALF